MPICVTAFCSAASVAHLAHFVHRVGQRLLAIHVQPALAAPHITGIAWVWSGVETTTRVEVLFLVEHLAEVGVGLGLGKALGHLAQVQRIDVAQGHDVFALQVVDVVGALVGHADARQVQLFVGAAGRQRRSRSAPALPTVASGGAGQHGLAEELATFEMFATWWVSAC